MTMQEKNEAFAAAKAEVGASKAHERLALLFDEGVFTEIDAFVRSADGYAEAVAAHGTIDGLGVYAYAQNSFSGGAMSKAQAAKIKKLYKLALKTGEPVVALYDSVGGRLQEGADLLAAYGDVLKLSNNLSGVVPQIAVILGGCYGAQALIAACADVVVMSRKASFSLETDGRDASAEENEKHGMAHVLAEDENEAIAKARELAALLPANNLTPACVAYDSIEAAGTIADGMSAREAALAAADAGSAIEMQAGYGKKALTALATVNGTTVGLVALEGEALDGKSCAKAARFVRLCDAFSMPVVTFLNAERFECIKGAAKLASAYAETTAAKITVITGDAFGSVYIAAAGTGASADMTFAWPSASVSALTPEAAVVMMLGDDWGGKLKGSQNPQQDRAAIVKEYKNTELTAMKAAESGYLDSIILPEETRSVLTSALEMLCSKRVQTLPKKHSNLYL